MTLIAFQAHEQAFKVIAPAPAEIVCKLLRGRNGSCQAAVESQAFPIEIGELIAICGGDWTEVDVRAGHQRALLFSGSLIPVYAAETLQPQLSHSSGALEETASRTTSAIVAKS